MKPHYQSAGLMLVLLLVSGCSVPDTSSAAAAEADSWKPIITRLMGGAIVDVRIDPAKDKFCLVEIRKRKDILVKIAVPVGGKLAQGVKTMQVGIAPTDGGYMNRADNLRYAIVAGGWQFTHIIRNPFKGMIEGATLSGLDATEAKPIECIKFIDRSAPAPSKIEDAEAFGGAVRVQLSNDASLGTPDNPKQGEFWEDPSIQVDD